MSNVGVIQELYRAVREQDWDAFTSMCTDDLTWVQSVGFPGGGTRRGASDVIENVFRALRREWDGFAFKMDSIHSDHDVVFAIGAYVGRHKKSGKDMRAGVVHVYDLREGQVARFRMFADTRTMWDAIE